jgi:hypothetical protein
MTLVEVLVSGGLTVAIMGAVLGALIPAHELSVRQTDQADAVQRLRVGVDTLSREIREATQVAPAVGDVGLEVRHGPVRRVYYWAADAAQLRLVAEDGTDVPVLDAVDELRFECEERFVRVHLGTRAGRERLRLTWDVAMRNTGLVP